MASGRTKKLTKDDIIPGIISAWRLKVDTPRVQQQEQKINN